jgi:hypothetical protein
MPKSMNDLDRVQFSVLHQTAERARACICTFLLLYRIRIFSTNYWHFSERIAKMHSISSLHGGRGGGVVAAVEETDVSAIGGGGGDCFWCREGDRTANFEELRVASDLVG